jgi:hypothetical protein
MTDTDMVDIEIPESESQWVISSGIDGCKELIQQLAPDRRAPKVGARNALKFGEKSRSKRSVGRIARSLICRAISRRMKGWLIKTP